LKKTVVGLVKLVCSKKFWREMRFSKPVSKVTMVNLWNFKALLVLLP